MAERWLIGRTMQPAASFVVLAGLVVPAAAIASPDVTATADSIALRQTSTASARGLLAPTAITVPKGTVEIAGDAFRDYHVGLEVSAGLSRSTEVFADTSRSEEHSAE